MGILITLNDKELDKYPSLHSSTIKELEADLIEFLNKRFDNFTIENTYTGNTLRKVPNNEVMG